MGKTQWFLKALGVFVIACSAGIIIIDILLPNGPWETMEFEDPYHIKRPAARAKTFMASTGIPWSTHVALEVMENG